MCVCLCVCPCLLSQRRNAPMLGHAIWRFSGITNSPAVAKPRNVMVKTMETTAEACGSSLFMMEKRRKHLMNRNFMMEQTMDTICFDVFYPHVCGCKSKKHSERDLLHGNRIDPWHWEFTYCPISANVRYTSKDAGINKGIPDRKGLILAKEHLR